MKKTSSVQTPNLDRMVAVKDKSEVVQEFIDWYCDVYLGDGFDQTTGERKREEIMAAFFQIDLREAEEERMALLRDIRQDHKVQDAIKRKASA